MLAARINHQLIEKSIESPFVTALVGPRWVGKTTFVKHYAETHPERKWVFINLDALELRRRIERLELEQMISEGAKQRVGEGEKIWLVIDEAQKAVELFDQIKLLYDHFKDQDKLKFIITGSAVLSLHQLSAESLAGRIEVIHLYEFTLREAVLKTGINLPTLSLLDAIEAQAEPESLIDIIETLKPFKPELENQLEHHLLWGGLPEAQEQTSSEAKIIYLNNYIQTYLEKDIRSIETISDINLYRNLMEIIAEQTGSLRDDKRIIEALGCKRDTLKKYRGYLAATLLYQDIFPYIGNTIKRLVKSPKSYLTNNGLISVLTGIANLSLLEKTGLIGHRFENWFLNEISTWLARNPMRSHIHYWRLSSGAEVDFVVVKKPYIYPFEITYSQKVEQKKVKNLCSFLAEEPKAKMAYYIYRGEFRWDKENKIIYLPAWAVG